MNGGQLLPQPPEVRRIALSELTRRRESCEAPESGEVRTPGSSATIAGPANRLAEMRDEEARMVLIPMVALVALTVLCL